MVSIFKAARAAVYHNTRRLTPAQIQAETGCTHIINGYFFNSKFQPVGWTVINGEIISRNEFSDWGVGFGGTAIPWGPEMTTDRSENFLSGVPILKDGNKLYRELTPDVANPSARSAVGWLDDGRVLLWCDKAILTRENLQLRLLELGCVDAIMLDGGGSTQGIFPEGKVTSTRKVPTFLLFWAEEHEKENDMGAIIAYSLKKQGSAYISRNFQVKEFACNDGSDTILISNELAILLQKIRDHFAKPVVINSAYRTATYNKKVGGATNSQHVKGTAADIVVSGVDPLEVAQYAEFLMPTNGGIGVYQTFTHVDVRTSRARWDNRSGKEIAVSGWPGYAEPTETDLALEWITKSGIMLGDESGDLMLDQPLTRKQFAVMLYRYIKN